MSNAVNPTSINSPGYLKSLWLSARPKTLTAAAVPVLVGSALAAVETGNFTPWISITAFLSALFIQIGTNFVNDALDFEKGADGDTRLGEKRATHQGWLTRRQVLTAAAVSFAAAFALGIPLVIAGGWPIIAIGLVSLFLGYAYTGGPYPLAYNGLGDLFVILFFGLIAVGGVFYLQTGTWTLSAVVAGLQVGMLATVLIAINNLRDLDQDRLVNKKTLAVRLGPKLGRLEVAALIATAFLLQSYWWSRELTAAFLSPWLALPVGIYIAYAVYSRPAGVEFNRLLARASFLHMLFGVLLSLGFGFA